jgi:hypothetical protein
LALGAVLDNGNLQHSYLPLSKGNRHANFEWEHPIVFQ